MSLPPGLAIITPTQEIKVEWKKLIFSLGEVLVYGFSGQLTGGATIPDAIASAFKAMSNFNLDEPASSRAYALIALAYATALDKLRSPEGSSGLTSDAAGEISLAIREAVETDTHVLEPDFFMNPTGFTLYQATRPLLVGALRRVRVSNEADAELGAKLDVAFSVALYEVIAKRTEYFSPIFEKLSNPAYGISRLEYDWHKYRRLLASKFLVHPVFGQETSKVSLSQIYINCRCRWIVEEDGDEGKSKSTQFGDLWEVIDSWIKENNPDDNVKIISGGPGSGKSSFAKYVAYMLSLRENARPIFVELQKLTSFADLQKAVARQLVDEGEHFSEDPLTQRDQNRPFVLIFDGLDELVVPGGDAAVRVADSFAAALGALLRTLNGPGICRAKAIVTGRTAIGQAFKSSVASSNEGASLEILGYVGNSHIEGGRFDLRPLWWDRYAVAFGLDRQVPEAYQVEELQSVTSEPLLSYLLAISGYAVSGWEEVARNHNKLYDKLLGEIWERRWGKSTSSDRGRVGPTLSLDRRSDLDALLESMALAAWWAGENRVATKENFERALVLNNAQGAWEKFRRDGGEALSNLALTFYFKKSGSDGQGIEFTHKSFSEYLVSRFIVRSLVEKICRVGDGFLEYGEALDRWSRFSTSAPITSDMRTFITNEFNLISDLSSTKAQFEEIVPRVAVSGLPVSRSEQNALRIWDANCTGEINLLLCYQSLLQSLNDRQIDIVLSGIIWPDKFKTGELIRRLSNYYAKSRSANLDLSYMSLKGGFLNGVFLVDANFGHSSLNHANFHCGSLHRASFYCADLSASCLSQADLSNADLSYATLIGADFSGALIEDAVLPEDWVDQVDPKTFLLPPLGLPILLSSSGIHIGPRDEGYPDYERVYFHRKENNDEYVREFEFPTFYD